MHIIGPQTAASQKADSQKAKSNKAKGAAEDAAISGSATGAKDYPVREYIAAMSRELAQMARWDGDEGLGVLLDAVEARASTRAQTPGLGWQRG